MHHDVDPRSKIIERQAHNFASEFLAPSTGLEPDLPRRLDWERLQRAKSKWGLSLAALVFRANQMGLWSEHTYHRAIQFLRIQGYPEPGTLGPPESPYLLGGAMELLAQEGPPQTI